MVVSGAAEVSDEDLGISEVSEGDSLVRVDSGTTDEDSSEVGSAVELVAGSDDSLVKVDSGTTEEDTSVVDSAVELVAGSDDSLV